MQTNRRFELKVFLAGRVALEINGLVIDDARFPGRQGRLLFAYLVAERGRAVPRDELAEALWGEAPPATWDKVLTVIISKLRSLLTDRGIDGATALTGAFGCYRLDLPEGTWVDVIAAADATGNAEDALAAGDLEQAKAAAALAASLVVQPFLPGEDGTWVEEKRRQLADVRSRALSVLADACLGSGEAPEAVKWAEQTVALAPFRETGYRRLMEAHAAAGNRAEALQVYERCRRLLAEELGAYPSPETESIYRGMLATRAAPAAAERPPEAQQPDAASVAAPELDSDGTSGRAVRGAARRRPLVVALAGGAILAATALGAGMGLFARGGSSNAALVAADSVGLVDSGSGRLVADVGVGATPTDVAVGAGAYWVSSADDDSVSRIDPRKRTVVQTITVGSSPSGIATGNGAVWVANSLDGTVSRIDPTINRVVQPIAVGNGPVGIVYARGSIWVANTGDDTVTRIDARSGKPLRTLPISATELVFGAGALWATERTANRVARIDVKTGTVAQLIPVGNGPTGVAFGNGAVWVANSLDGNLSRIDPSTNSVTATIPTGDGPTAVAVGARGVWVSNQFDGTLARIDPATNQVVRRIRIGNGLQGVATAVTDVLVTVRQSGADHRGGALTMRINRAVDSIDPAVAYDSTSWLFMHMSYDGLVAFNQTSGLAGTQLVPDLATSLPTPTDGGRTYTFRLRPQIRYSTGRPVRASDFRAAFERDFEIGEFPAPYYDGIVGAARCESNPTRCDLSNGIVADDTAKTVTFHLVAADPEFLYKLSMCFACVVPAGTPPRETRKHSLPGTGPYMIASYRSKRLLTLVRNPYFHEWSKAAQPDGYPDQIVVKIGGTPDEAVDDVIRGRADAFSTAQSETPPSEARMAALTTRHASQVHTNPQQATIALFLNTRLAPFDRLDVRRALNYAADRAAAVEALGGPVVAQPTCQILPPHFPGYRPYCPYAAAPSADGHWTAPNLAKARALIAASGTRGMKVTFWSWGDLGGLGPYAARLLRSLGFRVSIKTVAGAMRYFYAIDDSRTRAQIGTAEWITDYPTASGFFNAVLTCASFVPGSRANSNAAEFCDPRIDQQIDRARTEQATNTEAARGLWQRVDRETVDQAPWVPLVNPKVVDVVSKRVGNYQYNASGVGMLIDQLWVR